MSDWIRSVLSRAWMPRDWEQRLATARFEAEANRLARLFEEINS